VIWPAAPSSRLWLGESLAIKRNETKQETHLTRGDLLAALRREYQENDLFPSTDVTEDWLKLMILSRTM
jgi:proteasome-associated ATPase